MNYRSHNQKKTSRNKPNTTYIMMRVTPEIKAKIDEYAERMGVSTAEFLRRAVHDKMVTMDTDPLMDKVYDALDDPEYIRLLKEKLKES